MDEQASAVDGRTLEHCQHRGCQRNTSLDTLSESCAQVQLSSMDEKRI